MRHRRRGLVAQHRPGADRRRPATRVPRVRLDRPGRDRGRRRRIAGAAAARGQHRARREPGGGGRRRRHHRHHGHLAHALGDARRTDAGQRPSAHLGRRGRRRAQRHHRELGGAARQARRAGLRVRHADRHRGHRAPRARALARPRGRRPAARGAGRDRRIPRRLRDRRRLDARARPRRRRAQRQPAGRRPRRRRSLPRLRRRGAAVGDAAGRLPGRGRRRRRPPRGLRDRRRPRRARRAARHHRRGFERRGRAGAVPALHAEGDLRAAARGRRHAGQRRVHRPGAVRLEGRRGAAAGRPGAAARLRHQLLRRHGRAAVDRVAGADSL